jgi:ParB/RepB/Spo0J family partition protein
MGKDDGAATLAETITPPAPTGDAKPAQSAVLARSAIVRSRTNPRTHFDETYLKELASSIKEHGVIQPLLVRPLPGSRAQETFEGRKKGEALPTHEVVCGECRWRAAGIASVDELPVLIRHLEDIQVLQIQLVENLKRRDLHPLEEAEGFERLVKDHGITVPDVAARIGKSESYVWKLMKLLELTPECREILYQGKLTQSTALLVARAPAYLQMQIAKDIMKGMYGNAEEPMSFRQAVQHIHNRYMLRLSDAPFDIKDESLVAKAGSCKACPKRTGANSDLFDDVKNADTCTDPKCFDTKKVAHVEQLRTAAEAKGQKVIAGREAKEIVPHSYNDQLKGYRNLDEKDWFGGEHKSLRQVLGKDAPAPVLIEHPHSHKMIEALPNDAVNKLLKAKGLGRSSTSARTPAAKKDPGREIFNQWRAKATEAVFAAIVAGKMKAIHVDVARHLGKLAALNVYGELEDHVAKLLDVGKIGKNAGIESFLEKCPDNMVAPALLLLIMAGEFEDTPDQVNAKRPMLDLCAKQTGVDLKAIENELKADLRKADADKKAATKKVPPKATSAKTPAKAAKRRTPNAAFMSPLHCSAPLQAVVGGEALPRVEIVSRLWAYIKKHKLQDNVNKRMVNCDEKLKAIFGKAKVSMFEMAGLIGKHASSKPFAGTATKAPAPIATKPAKGKKTTAAEAKAGIAAALNKPAKADDAPLPLKGGAQIDPVSAWPFPTAKKP